MTYRPCKQCGNWHDDGTADYCLECIDSGIFEVPVIADEFHTLVTNDYKKAFAEMYVSIHNKESD